MNIGSSGSGSSSSTSNYSQGQRAEAERWLNIAQKLLTARDLHGTKTFAIRARESDPRLDTANQILAVADTLLAAESRVVISSNANQFDWYAILQLGRLTHSIELVATQYRKLAVLLSPDRNRFPFADQAFKLVCEAWSVLSNPSKKSSYDAELQLSQLAQLGGHQQQQQQTPPPPPSTTPTPPVRKSPKPPTKDDKTATEEDERPSLNDQTESDQPSFWTACPYCYILYEYPKVYEDCTLRCQNCKRAFHGVVIASPPQPPVTGNGEYFCCWGYFPLGFNGNVKNMNSNWSPFSAMFTCPVGNGNVGNAKKGNNNVARKSAARPRVYYDDDDDDDDEDDDDLYVEISDDDDDEWENERRKKKAKSVKGKESVRRNVGSGSGSGGGMQPHVVLGLGNAETNRRGLVGSSGRKQMAKGMKDLGKLDLNVEFSNEVEDPVPGMSEGNENGNGNGNGNRDEDNIEGIGFFEGLDEFLSSLPILNVVGDDKVKAN